jgi:hypothetical protein
MRYSVSHLTTLKYAQPARMAQFNVRLRPADWTGQTVSDFTLTLDPQPGQVAEGPGGYHVNEARFVLREATAQLQIESRFTVEVEPLPFFVHDATGPGLADLRERAMRKPDLSDLGPASYIFASAIAQPEPAIAHWAASFLDEGMPVMEAGRALMSAIHEEFAYDADRGVQPAAWRVPGFQPRHDHRRARARHSGGLCQRLPADPAAAGQGAPCRGRRHACLGQPLVRRGTGLDRLRSHQRLSRRHRPHLPWHGSRLCRRGAAGRDFPRIVREGAVAQRPDTDRASGS